MTRTAPIAPTQPDPERSVGSAATGAVVDAVAGRGLVVDMVEAKVVVVEVVVVEVVVGTGIGVEVVAAATRAPSTSAMRPETT